MTEAAGELIEEFKGIKFTRSALNYTPAKVTETPTLANVFSCIINQDTLEVTKYDLLQILTNDIQIDKSVNKQLVAVLVDALMYYIIRWPGWQRQSDYDKGILKFEDWYTRFRQYLIFKCKFVIKSAPEMPPASVCLDKDTQTDDFSSNSSKPYAPYGLCIGGLPVTLNNLVFEEQNGNILIRKCIERNWVDPVLNQLLHWPNVSVSLKLPELYVSRSNVHHNERYMTLCSEMELPVERGEPITHVKRIKHDRNLEQPYSFVYLRQYVNQLIKVLEKIPGISRVRVCEIKIVLEEFLKDINEANVHNRTMCTNMSVCYQIGKFTYIRNRRTIVEHKTRTSKNQNAITFCERVTPQMDFKLFYFTGVQDYSDLERISFVGLNDLCRLLKTNISSESLQNTISIINTSCLMFTCMLCEIHKSGMSAQSDMIEHLRTEHKAEQHLLCFKCCKEFSVYSLTLNRWTHDCTGVTNTEDIIEL